MYGNRRRFGEIRLLARLCRAVTDSHGANGSAGGGFPLFVDFYPFGIEFYRPGNTRTSGTAGSPARVSTIDGSAARRTV